MGEANNFTLLVPPDRRIEDCMVYVELFASVLSLSCTSLILTLFTRPLRLCSWLRFKMSSFLNERKLGGGREGMRCHF